MPFLCATVFYGLFSLCGNRDAFRTFGRFGTKGRWIGRPKHPSQKRDQAFGKSERHFERAPFLLREPQEQPQQFHSAQQGREPSKAEPELAPGLGEKTRRAARAQGQDLGNGQISRWGNRAPPGVLQQLRQIPWGCCAQLGKGAPNSRHSRAQAHFHRVPHLCKDLRLWARDPGQISQRASIRP